MKLLHFILIYVVVNFGELQTIESEVDDYIKTVLSYYRVRNVRILTHFTCFTTGK